MGASATDIITYVGVPIAVLGIMPVLYTCIKVLITLQKIKHELRHHGSRALARSNLMSGIVEIEMPRYSLKPLDREDPEYWQENHTQASSVKGGSWAIMNWDKLLVGHQLFRLQYSDELRFEQAEVEFEELLAFLLDRGAVPDAEGFRVLRALGLRTPNGTDLLVSPDKREFCLKVTTPDHSEGHLSLALRWELAWNLRNAHSLPPGWTRLEVVQEQVTEVKDDRPTTTQTEESTITTDYKGSDASILPSKEKEENTDVEQPPTPPRSVRLHFGPHGILDAFYETPAGTLGSRVSIYHLDPQAASASSTAPLWFAVATTATLPVSTRQFWNFSVPLPILRLSQEKSLPCGVLCLLNVLDESETPAWATPYDPNAEHELRHQKFCARNRKIAAEARMTPAARTEAMRVRLEEERWEMLHSVQADLKARREREAKRMTEALNSPRLSNAVAAEAFVKWLRTELADDTLTLQSAVEGMLYKTMTDTEFARELASVLDAWRQWTDAGGMGMQHLEMVRERQRVFAYATCVLALVGLNVGEGSGMAEDLRECMKVWKTVRLG